MARAKPTDKKHPVDQLEGRLRWALESVLTGYQALRLDRNTIEDWSRATAEQLWASQEEYIRPLRNGPEGSEDTPG